MGIHGVGLSSVSALELSHAYGHHKADKPARPPAAAEPPVDQAVLTEEPATQAPQEGQESRGVLRNLLAGHYKGVADVRLRINFHEELTAMQAQATRQTAAGAASELSMAVDEAVAALAGGQTLTVDQQDAVADLGAAFDQAVADVTAAYSGDSTDGAGLRSAIQSAFDTLLTGLEPFFAPAPPPLGDSAENMPLVDPGTEPMGGLGTEPTGGDAPIVDAPIDLPIVDVPVDEVAVDVMPVIEAPVEAESLLAPASSPLDALRAAFAEALGALDAGLTPASILPPLSAPSGNGKAYDKFLGIYNALQAPPPETPDPGVDVQA